MARIKCPHRDIQFCPLYIASNGHGLGCEQGTSHAFGGCAVEEGAMDYETAVAELREKLPHVVTRAEFDERKAASNEQRNRNMRLLRIA